MKVILCLSLLFYFISAEQANAVQVSEEKLVIRAGVAKGFQDGLHAKYLAYFAEKLSVELDISTMSFARRIQQLKTGKLDLMVGLQRTKIRKDEFIYIFPAYETLRFRFYSLKENSDSFTEYKDLEDKDIGVNRHAKYFSTFDLDKNIKKHSVSSLKQNIELLLHKRIDAFIHYEESTLPILEKLNLNDKIVKTLYQPPHEYQHYLVISSHSPLTNFQTRLEGIVKDAVENGDLGHIRSEHYRQKNNTIF
jgi:ABC-type amino acid transport substrate-binding protein